jgi:hypothetical protein
MGVYRRFFGLSLLALAAGTVRADDGLLPGLVRRSSPTASMLARGVGIVLPCDPTEEGPFI